MDTDELEQDELYGFVINVYCIVCVCMGGGNVRGGGGILKCSQIIIFWMLLDTL